MTPAAMLQVLAHWRGAGWLRSLDLAFAEFIHGTDPRAPETLLLAAALSAQLEARGHSGLPLASLATDPQAVLDWPLGALPELQQAFAGWPADVAALRAAWSGLQALEIDPADGAGHGGGTSPLVLSGNLLQLRRYWRYESRVAAQVRARTGAAALPAGLHAEVDAEVDIGAARRLLDLLFGPAQAGAAVDWQKVACAVAVRRRLTIVTGGPGTGKTYTAARLLVLLQSLHTGPAPLRVALAAPTGKAAARLRQSIQTALQGLREQPGPALSLDPWAGQLGPARTLHALLGTQPGTRRFRHDAGKPLDLDLLFVDEASMVHLEMMALLLDALPAGARVVLLGDKDQLASVEAGAVLGDLCAGADAGRYGPQTAAWIHALTGQQLPASALGDGLALAQQTVVLRHSHRFDGPIGQLAQAINRGDAAAVAGVAAAPGAGQGGAVAVVAAHDASLVPDLALQGRPGAPGGYRPYLELLGQRPVPAPPADVFDAWVRTVLRRFDRFRVLCAVRDGPWGVAGLNTAIERALSDAGLLSRRGAWYEGRPVMVTRNSPALGVFNGDIGIVLRPPDGSAAMRCYFLDGDGLRSVSVGRLAEVETAFALTVHKSQGSEFEHVVLVLPDDDVALLTRELVYTGVTRASAAFTLVARQPGLLATAVTRVTRRVSGLAARLE